MMAARRTAASVVAPVLDDNRPIRKVAAECYSALGIGAFVASLGTGCHVRSIAYCGQLIKWEFPTLAYLEFIKLRAMTPLMSTASLTGAAAS